MTFKNFINNSSLKTIILLRRLYKYVDLKKKQQIFFLIFLMIISGIAEIFSLAALIPFLSLLTNPSKALENPQVIFVAQLLKISDPSHLLIVSTAFFIIAAILSSLIRILNIYLNGKFSARVGSSLSSQAFRKTLYQPYKFHTQIN